MGAIRTPVLMAQLCQVPVSAQGPMVFGFCEEPLYLGKISLILLKLNSFGFSCLQSKGPKEGREKTHLLTA